MRFCSLSPRAGGIALLCAILLAGTAPEALGASFDITSGTNTTAQTLNNNETGMVAHGASLISSGKNAISINGTNVIITNAGLIEDTKAGDRAIDTGFSDGDFNITLDNSGTITSSGDAFRINADTGTGNIVVMNSGTISSTGTGSNNGQALDFNNIVSGLGTISITNTATGVIEAADADAIRPGTNTTINNYGLIESFNGTPTSTGNDGIDFQATGTGTVNNYQGGQIIGARHGITGDLNQTINNSGIITGNAGSGINLDTTSGTSTVVNTSTGVITGTIPSGAANDGDGIDIDYLVNITNAGKILAVGTGTGGEINEALAIGGGTVDNSGLIQSDQRAITVDNSNLGNAFGAFNLTNEASGTITGKDGEAIMITSAFDNTITNKGVINGSITMGGGNDTINLYTGSTTGSLNGAAGSDTINLYGTATGTGTLANVSNVETLNINGGTWTVNGTQSYSNGVTIASGAHAIITGEIDGNITNNGLVSVHETNAAFNGTFTNNGGYVSDPSTQSFNNLSNGANGTISASAGDRFQIAGNFANTATQTGNGNTDGAELEFMGVSGTSHNFQIAGTDYGTDVGLAGDFKWGTLDIDAGNTLNLQRGASATQTALYIASLIGAEITGGTITNITGTKGLIVYYDPFLAANAYLDDKNYALDDGGELVANVPEPASIALMISGLTVLSLRRKRKPKQ
jgi:hypothetical protein